MASIYNNIAENHTGPQAGPYLATVRNMIPAFTVAPNNNLPGTGYCIEPLGRAATCDTVYQGGYAAGQIDPNFVMFREMINGRPILREKVGLVNSPDLNDFSQANQAIAAANGTMINQPHSGNQQDLITFGAKIAGIGRYTNESETYNQQPALGSNPLASRLGFAAAGNSNALSKTAPLNNIRWNATGGGQTKCGENPVAASVNQTDNEYIFGADYKNTPMNDYVTLGQGLQPLSAAYNQLIQNRQLGSTGSL